MRALTISLFELAARALWRLSEPTRWRVVSWVSLPPVRRARIRVRAPLRLASTLVCKIRMAATARRARPARAPRILFVVKNGLSLQHLLPVAAALANDPDEAPYFTTGIFGRGRRAVAESMPPGARYVSYLRAVTSPWSVALFAHHHHAWLFAPPTRRVYVGHGVETGGVGREGEVYRYGHKALQTERTSAYDCFLATNGHERALGAAHHPALPSRVAVVGNLLADRMLAADQERALHRARLGIREDERVLLLLSSWGRHSLLRSEVEAAGRAIAELSAGWRVILSVHPKNRDVPGCRQLLRDLADSGARILDGGEDWVPYLAAADAAVSDFTSLSLYFLVTLRPLVHLPVPPGKAHPNGMLHLVHGRLPRLRSLADAPARLDALVAGHDPAAARELRELLFPCLGQAGDNIRRTIRELACP